MASNLLKSPRPLTEGQKRLRERQRLFRIRSGLAPHDDAVEFLRNGSPEQVRECLVGLARRIAPARQRQVPEDPIAPGVPQVTVLPTQPGTPEGRTLGPEEAVWLGDLLRLIASVAKSGEVDRFAREVGPAVGLALKPRHRPKGTGPRDLRDEALIVVAYLLPHLGKTEAVELAAEVVGASKSTIYNKWLVGPWDVEVRRNVGFLVEYVGPDPVEYSPALKELQKRVRARPLQYSKKVRDLFGVT